MARKDFQAPSGSRSSALWGTGNRGGESRSNALWGKGGRGRLLMTIALVALAAPIAAVADSGSSKSKRQKLPDLHRTEPAREGAVEPERARQGDHPERRTASRRPRRRSRTPIGRTTSSAIIDGDREVMKDRYKFVNSVAVTIKAEEAAHPRSDPGPDRHAGLAGASDRDSVVASTSGRPPRACARCGARTTGRRRRPRRSRSSTRASTRTGPTSTTAPASSHNEVITTLRAELAGRRSWPRHVRGRHRGRQRSRQRGRVADLGHRDARRHGRQRHGADERRDRRRRVDPPEQGEVQHPRRQLLAPLDVTPSNFTQDPLDRAVEKLWFGGVVVVVASGNYGIPNGPSGVKFAPGNDPFVITVGAIDLEGSVKPTRHDVPSWSAYGYTYDGFRKPEVSAAGRYMVGPVPAGATLKKRQAGQRPQRARRCASRARRSRRRSWRARPPRSWPGIPTGRPTRSRAR